MLRFECNPLSQNNIYLRIITDHTEKGTLYRLASAIFVLGLDIHSGEIKTTFDGSQYLADDKFILKNNSDENQNTNFSYHLGILMESLLNRNQEPEEILNLNPSRKLPELKEIINDGFQYLIEEYEDKNQFLFYFEAKDRSGLLVSITKFFYENDLNIIEANIETDYQSIAKDSFLLEYKDKQQVQKFKNILETNMNIDN